MDKKNIINLLVNPQAEFSDMPSGLLPYAINAHILTDGKQVIITDSDEEAEILYNSLQWMCSDYYLISGADNMGFNDIIKYIYMNGYSIICSRELMEKTFPSHEDIESGGIILTAKTQVDTDKIADVLDNRGFERVENVGERGEYAIRGFIIDIYGFISEPVRVELFDDEIESIRIFDINSQRSLNNINRFIIADEIKDGILSFDEFFKEYVIYDFTELRMEFSDSSKYENLTFRGHTVNDFKSMLDGYSDYDVYVFSDNDYDRKRVNILFKDRVTVLKGSLYMSFIDHKNRFICINEFDLFSKKRYTGNPEYADMPLSLIESIDDLEPGDLVVHQIYGIGRFKEIERISLGKRQTDCLKILYRDNDKLYVPVDQIHLIDKYHSMNDSNIPLSPLSREQFSKKKNKVYKSLKNIAGELIRIYAEREIAEGISFPEDNDMQIEMEEQFPFQETRDQIKAIEDVKNDMILPKAMERLVCGEVGFGKTEVAARAIFKCILGNKQAVIIVPTTILAEQHYRTLSSRFSEYGIHVEMLSRFRKRDKNLIYSGIKDGAIDVIIGTTAVLSKNVDFKDLGLVIIDEEHRFGVRQKEKLKEIKTNVDVLYMSATPIPRTLEMVFSGIRDISNINTPPKGRKPVKTELIKWNEDIIRNAIINEINRGGQVYFVHNRIESLESVRIKLKRIVPEARIVTAHAQLPSSELEQIMIDFWDGKFDVFLSTAIIESGIDNPNTNTMFINQGERFGIAQLHQLRGRIGRSHEDAFCYVILPAKDTLGKKARMRMSAFKSYNSLGAGLKLAMKDLEIRGAGNLLGTKQHGNIGIVGFSMYYKLLKQAIDELKGLKPAEIIDPSVNINMKTFIPDNFNLTAKGKTKLYREITSISELKDIETEKLIFRDRYGRMPEPIKGIFDMQEIKLLCRKAKISRVNTLRESLRIDFFINHTPDRKTLNKLLSQVEQPFEIKYENPFSIIIKGNADIFKADYISKLLKSMI